MNRSEKPAAAIVLGMHATGLRTAWCLHDAGVIVHGVALHRREPGLLSRRIRHTRRFDLGYEPDGVAEFLIEYAKGFERPPVVFAIADVHVLELSKSLGELNERLITFSTTYEVLSRIVSKDGLYRVAGDVGLPVPPAIIEPAPSALREWCDHHEPPYFVKPYFEGISDSSLKAKNRTFATREDLLTFVAGSGSKALIVQRRLFGGDGHIFDCYGYCDRRGDVVTMASHRRIRQRPVHTGTTCYGEIPARSSFPGLVTRIFENTQRLLSGLGYHGIFGIEWLADRESGDLYLIDFNARPFSTINHLADCGLNLPALAYRELTGHDISDVPIRPELTHKTWMGANRDWSSFGESEGGHRIQWVREFLGCRSHAFWRPSDPMPGLREAFTFFRRPLTKVEKGIRAWRTRVWST